MRLKTKRTILILLQVDWVLKTEYFNKGNHSDTEDKEYTLRNKEYTSRNKEYTLRNKEYTLRIHTCVSFHVRFDINFHRKFLVTHCACIGLVLRMCDDVPLQYSFLTKFPTTNWTDERFLSRMDSHVLLKADVCAQLLVTYSALKHLYAWKV